MAKVRGHQGKLPGGSDKEPNLLRPLASGGRPSEEAGLGKTKGASGLACVEFEGLAMRPNGEELRTPGCTRGREPGGRESGLEG